MNGRAQCCLHPEIHRAELLLASGVSLRSVARKLSIGYDALFRHWRRHVPEERKAVLVAGPAVVERLASRVADENVSVLDHLKAVRAGLYSLYDAAVEAGDRTGGALLAGRLHENLGTVAKLTGALASSPLVQNNIQQNIFISPQFAQLQAALLRVLSEYPDARTAVITEFRKLETASTAPQIEGSTDGRAVSAA